MTITHSVLTQLSFIFSPSFTPLPSFYYCVCVYVRVCKLTDMLANTGLCAFSGGEARVTLVCAVSGAEANLRVCGVDKEADDRLFNNTSLS